MGGFGNYEEGDIASGDSSGWRLGQIGGTVPPVLSQGRGRPGAMSKVLRKLCDDVCLTSPSNLAANEENKNDVFKNVISIFLYIN